MVHKTSKWNISISKGEEFAHKYLIEILRENPNNTLSLQELIIQLNNRTKHIHFINNHKKKPFSVYIRDVYGSIINFLDKFLMYGILFKNEKKYIMLMEDYLKYNNYKESDNKINYNEWEFINIDDVNDFILI